MKFFDKPVVVMSKCLGMDACRYNGEMIRDSLVEKLTPFVEVIPVCPEVEIGLGTSRPPIRLVTDGKCTKLIQPLTQQDVTKKMNQFSHSFLTSLPSVDGFILKNRSPSCAVSDAKLYRESEKPYTIGKNIRFIWRKCFKALSPFSD